MNPLAVTIKLFAAISGVKLGEETRVSDLLLSEYCVMIVNSVKLEQFRKYNTGVLFISNAKTPSE